MRRLELVCPLCNSLTQYEVKCHRCGNYMCDQGPIVNYLDDYSPYLSRDLTQLVDGASHDKCVHLFKCKKCYYDKRIEIDRVRM